MVAETISATDGLELSGAYDPLQPGVEVAGVACGADPAAVDCDVVVEFTVPDVVIGNVGEWSRRGFNAVVGTSGFDAARLEQLEAVWSGSSGNCLVVPNFSIGAVVMMRFAELAAPHFGGAEVVEMHHDKKVDHPSGTALATAARMAAAGATNVADPNGRGTAVDGIPVHSMRLPGIVASQEVLFGGVGETLSIRHDTFSRQAFMPGVLAAVRAVADLPAQITVGLDSVLGI
jgi:4-hydroxy-tetrahydrodipicolinate reductase